jgi:hypothetical protein
MHHRKAILKIFTQDQKNTKDTLVFTETHEKLESAEVVKKEYCRRESKRVSNNRFNAIRISLRHAEYSHMIFNHIYFPFASLQQD